VHGWSGGGGGVGQEQCKRRLTCDCIDTAPDAQRMLMSMLTAAIRPVMVGGQANGARPRTAARTSSWSAQMRVTSTMNDVLAKAWPSTMRTGLPSEVDHGARIWPSGQSGGLARLRSGQVRSSAGTASIHLDV
jgi:hypothetical protein